MSYEPLDAFLRKELGDQAKEQVAFAQTFFSGSQLPHAPMEQKAAYIEHVLSLLQTKSPQKIEVLRSELQNILEISPQESKNITVPNVRTHTMLSLRTLVERLFVSIKKSFRETFFRVHTLFLSFWNKAKQTPKSAVDADTVIGRITGAVNGMVNRMEHVFLLFEHEAGINDQVYSFLRDPLQPVFIHFSHDEAFRKKLQIAFLFFRTRDLVLSSFSQFGQRFVDFLNKLVSSSPSETLVPADEAIELQNWEKVKTDYMHMELGVTNYLRAWYQLS